MDRWIDRRQIRKMLKNIENIEKCYTSTRPTRQTYVNGMKTLYSTTAEYTFFAGVHGTLSS